jgi:hypothetical protein
MSQKRDSCSGFKPEHEFEEKKNDIEEEKRKYGRNV